MTLTPYPSQIQRLILRLLLVLGVAAVLSTTGSGCRTAHGFGEDVEKAGDAIQEGTR